MSEPNCSSCKFWGNCAKATIKNLHSGGDVETMATIRARGWCVKDRKTSYSCESCGSYEPTSQ
ncbi:MAG: hypothetical protein ACYSR8_11875 [Planctomycetota bacterium]